MLQASTFYLYIYMYSFSLRQFVHTPFTDFADIRWYQAQCCADMYRIYSAIRQGISLSRMSTNNQISPMQFCC